MLKEECMEDFSKYNPEGSTLRKTQHRMVNILSCVAAILDKHKIPYFLHGGTLLGAVRHGGFIPWDDDLDIAVLWNDIPKIREILQSELPENMCYQDITTDYNYPMIISKVRDKKSIFDDPYSKRIKDRGIYIDLIPIEEVVAQKIKDSIDFVYIRSIRGIHNYSDRFIEKLLGYICYPFAVSAIFICRLWVKFFHTHKWGNTYGWKTPKHFKEEDIFPLRTIVFEGEAFASPANPDKFLTTNYGDYMQIPPEDKRVTHLAKITFLDEQ